MMKPNEYRKKVVVLRCFLVPSIKNFKRMRADEIKWDPFLRRVPITSCQLMCKGLRERYHGVHQTYVKMVCPNGWDARL